MYVSRFTKFVILPQNVLGLAGLAYLIYYQLWWWLLATYVSWVVIGVFGVSLVYHKIYAHRSFEVRPALTPLLKVFTLLGMLSGQGSPLSYAVIHRTYHHPNADRNANDPHSPHLGSFWHAYYGWHFKMFHFNMHSIRDLTRSKFLLWCHHNYYAFFLLSHLIIGLVSFKVLIFCVVFPSLLHVHEMNILNSLSHMRWFGYRNFESDDESVNNLIFGWLSWGTGFHNNHHARPSEWHNQVRWYEVDPFRWIVPWIMKPETSAVRRFAEPPPLSAAPRAQNEHF